MRIFSVSQGLGALAVSATLLMGTGACEKAKEALKEALGIADLDATAREKLLVDTGWHDAAGNNTSAKLENFEVLGGFELKDNFKGDLGKTVDLPVPFLSVPDKAKGASQNQGSIVLLKASDFQLADKKITKFRIVAVASYDATKKELSVSGDTVNQALSDKQKIGLSNPGSQTGKYLIVRGKGDKGLMYLNGVATLKKADGSAPAAVEDALVFTSESPFVTTTGPDGKYFLALVEGSKGQVTAYKNAIKDVATGTPVTTAETVAYAGVLTGYHDKFKNKLDALGSAAASAKGEDTFTKLDTKVSTFGSGWTAISKDLVFRQPPLTPPPALPPASQPAKPGTGSGDTPAELPVDNPLPDAAVAREETPDTAYNENLGCDDVNKLVFDGSVFDKYSADTAGWRAVGDVRVTAEMHTEIFGNPDTLHGVRSQYLDAATGYCLLTTGDSQFQLSQSATFQPVDDMSSSMWQTLKIPSAASGYKSIQLRAAFFSQEFPKFVGTEYNDSFFIKFDEHIDNIGDGDLNRLAGGTDDPTVAGCSEQTGANIKCGEWESVQRFNSKLNGELWGIASSSSASGKLSDLYKCDAGGTGKAGVKCFPGIVPPRTFCANLTAEDMGQERTLRVAISDVGDQYFDSAIAIDSVVFSKDVCGDKGFAGDDKSRANQL